MFERFTNPSRTAVKRAMDEAQATGHDAVGQGHLLVAVLADRVPETIRARGVDAAYVRDHLPVPAAPPRKRWFHRTPFAPRTKKTLELALREAVDHKHRFIANEHLLLAMVRDAGGPAWGILARAGVDPDELRTELLAGMPR